MKKSTEKPYQLWGGRFEKGAGKNLEAFSFSLPFDYRLAGADIEGTRVYAQALERAGLLSKTESARALKALDRLARDLTAEGANAFEGAREEDIHTYILGRLRGRIGPLADKLHTGRSRNEQVALDFRIWVRQAVRDNQVALGRLLGALLDSAEKYPEVILPGYTHLRRAQPVLWPHYLLAYFEMFRRDYERLEAVFATTDVMPLGSGALAGSGFPMDRKRVARELGFSQISRNSMDAVCDRDFAMEYLFAASMCFLHLSRLSEDWIVYSSEEFGFLEMADEVSSGSSLMPQKINPDSLELIRGKTGRVLGSLMGLGVTLKGLPLTYNRDLQEDKEPVFDAAEQVQLGVELTAEVVATARLYPESMRKASSEGWLCATDLAEFLAAKGVPFREAHQVVGKLVLENHRAGRQPADCSLADLRKYSTKFDKKALVLLTPEAGTRQRAVEGATALRRTRSALKAARSWLDAMLRAK